MTAARRSSRRPNRPRRCSRRAAASATPGSPSWPPGWTMTSGPRCGPPRPCWRNSHSCRTRRPRRRTHFEYGIRSRLRPRTELPRRHGFRRRDRDHRGHRPGCRRRPRRPTAQGHVQLTSNP